jgi:hypothetical protein
MPSAGNIEIGILEWWSNGVMERRKEKIGILKSNRFYTQYSNTPVLQYSSVSSLQHSITPV